MIALESLLTCALLGATTQPAPTLGEESFGNGPVPANAEWAEGLLSVANHPQRVYRRWVNGNEEFFYAGETNQLNSVLTRFARIEAPYRDVIFMPQAGETQSFEGKAVSYNWSVYAPSGIMLAMARGAGSSLYPDRATLTIHVAGSIDLGALMIPSGLTLIGARELSERYKREANQGLNGDKHMMIATSQAHTQLELTLNQRSIEVSKRLKAITEFLVATRGVELELAHDEGPNGFSAAIINRRSVPVTLVLPGDGSRQGMRTPYLRFEIHDAVTGVPRPQAWIGCGTIDPMRADQIVTLAPGERRPIDMMIRMHLPGTYRMVLGYDNDPQRGLPRGQKDPALLELVKTTERLILASNAIEFTIE
ncbi:MAG: hypothetical protein ACI841_003994 [Planctomycetota bacterium]|jgi:hypothetical protein